MSDFLRITQGKAMTSRARVQKELDAITETAAVEDNHVAHKLEWGGTLFAAAARQEAYGGLLFALEAGSTVEAMRDRYAELVTYGARYPKHSTSPEANLMFQYRLAAQAEVLEDLEYEVKFQADHADKGE